MKHLRIKSGKGEFSIDGLAWKDLDHLGKEDLLKIVDFALSDDFEMDKFEKEKILQPAHEIIYRNLYIKLSELSMKKDRFRDESQQQFRESLIKYKS